MFDAVVESDTVEEMLEPVSTIVDECKIHLDEDQMQIQAVDPANVAMVDSKLTAAAFESYEADDGTIGVNLNRLENIIGMAGSGDLVHLELNEETRKMEITVGSDLSYTLALIDPDSIREEPEIPDLDLPGVAYLEGNQLGRGIKAADMVSDHIGLKIDQEKEAFLIEAEGDTDDVDLELTREELIDLTTGPANSLFSLDYLQDMNKAVPKKAEVQIRLGEEFPTKINYEIAEGQGEVMFMLAPRIQSD
jgi:proliferating cell nuclear antigen